MELDTWFATFEVEVIHSRYINNNRLYLWLRDTNDGEPICDITENHPEISDEDLKFGLDEWMERVVLDNDFIMCLWWDREAKIWCMDNLKCLGWWTIDWYPCIIVLPETIIGEDLNK